VNQSKDGSDVTVTMLRAFVALSRTLNITKACEDLKTTRQTLRRHIKNLERIKGQPLFVVENREYFMTPFGRASVADAETILRQIETWSGQSKVNKKNLQWLEMGHYLDPSGREFFSQQHPIFHIAANGLPIVKNALAAWGTAQTQIEDPAMAAVRPYLVIYRKDRNGWVLVEIGKHSAYAKWFGWAWSKSAIGKLMQDDNVGDDFNEFIAGAYARIYGEGGVRLDHLFAYLPKEGSDVDVPVSFQRLLMGCVFPDGTPNLGVLVVVTNKVEIDALQHAAVPDVPKELIMDFEL
jgi:hypothetical protein